MASVNVVAGTHEFSGGNNEIFAVGTSGDVEDFTWSVEYTLDLGATWSKYKDGLGDSVITGSDGRVVQLLSNLNRVNLITMGTATSVLIEASK